MILETFSVALAILGAVGAVVFLHDRYWPWRRLSWRFAEKAASRFAEEMSKDGFDPTVIVGIGRGGAVMGALISGCLGHRPLLVIDRKYLWIKGRRLNDMILHLHLPGPLIEKVLLVAGDSHTGNTMRLYYDYFIELGAKEVRRAVLYRQKTGVEPIEHIGMESVREMRLPWMFHHNYIRDSRKRSEAEASAIRSLRSSALSTSEDEVLVCFLIRHAESVDNAAGDRYSGITECELTQEGLRHAQNLAKALQGEQVQLVYTSPMKRCVSTARAISSFTGAPVRVDARLREMDYGEWEGLTRKEVCERWPEQYAAYKDNPIQNHPPHAENPKKTTARATDCFWEIVKAATSEHFRRVAIVSHNSLLRLLVCSLVGESLENYRQHRCENASITKLVLDTRGKVHIEYENQTDYVQPIS